MSNFKLIKINKKTTNLLKKLNMIKSGMSWKNQKKIVEVEMLIRILIKLVQIRQIYVVRVECNRDKP